jgi:hypothetical protein
VCGAIGYLICFGAIILLANYRAGERFGYEGFYYIGRVQVEKTDEYGRPDFYYRKAILPSSKFVEMLVVGLAFGVGGFKVALLHGETSMLIPTIGLVASLLAWLALVVFFFSL